MSVYIKSKYIQCCSESDCTSENRVWVTEANDRWGKLVIWPFLTHTETPISIGTNCPKFTTATFSHLFESVPCCHGRTVKDDEKIRQIIQAATVPGRGYLGNTFSLLAASLWKEDWERRIKIRSQEEVAIQCGGDEHLWCHSLFFRCNFSVKYISTSWFHFKGALQCKGWATKVQLEESMNWKRYVQNDLEWFLSDVTCDKETWVP